MVGAAEDVGKTADYAFAKTSMDKAKLAGFDSIRITQTWTKDQTKLGAVRRARPRQRDQRRPVHRAAGRALALPVRFERDPAHRRAARRFRVVRGRRGDAAIPFVHDFIVGNEPNLNRFWLPQFNPDGTDAAAPAYEQLLATTYDALKTVRPRSTVYGGALAPRGVDKPNTGRDTHSPTAFITDLGAAYRASGRAAPDHGCVRIPSVPGDVDRQGRTFRIRTARRSASPTTRGSSACSEPRSTARPSVARHCPCSTTSSGSRPRSRRPRHRCTSAPSPPPRSRSAEATQAQYYLQAMQMTFCQPTVLGLMLFHVQDEPDLSAWQSGEYYVDGTPKTSLLPVRRAAFSVRRGIVAACPGLQLTPKLKLTAGKPTKTVPAGDPHVLTRLRLHGAPGRQEDAHGHGRRRCRQEASVPRRADEGAPALPGRQRDRGAERGATRPGHANVPAVNGQYVAYTFYRVDPAWRRLPIEERAAAKDAFAEVLEELAPRFEHLRTYSTRACGRRRTSSSGRSPSATRTWASSAPR